MGSRHSFTAGANLIRQTSEKDHVAVLVKIANVYILFHPAFSLPGIYLVYTSIDLGYFLKIYFY